MGHDYGTHHTVVPGGVGAAIKAARVADKGVDALKGAKAADKAADVAKGGDKLTDAGTAAKGAAGKADAKGGTYVLKNEKGEVMRTGRTNDLSRREGEHKRGSETKDLRFEPVHKTDVKAEQRGLEEILYKGQEGGKGAPLDKIKPISDNNRKAGDYRKAAEKYLDKGQ